MSTDYQACMQAVIDGDAGRARELAEAAVASGEDLLPAIERGFAAGIQRVGELWEQGEYFLPELVQGAEAMKAAMGVIQPVLRARGGAAAAFRGRVVIGTMQGDLHDIGKTLVATLLSAHGFQVHDLGTDVPVARFVAVAREVGAQVVAASALLTTTMALQRDLVLAVAASGTGARVLVGGAPTTAAWAREIGAAHAADALAAVSAAQGLVS